MSVDDSYTKSLLHFDGADASTTFTDESGKTWTRAGDAQIDTAQSVFGGASGLFDGTGDYITTPYTDDFDVGSGEFTVDFRMRPTTDTTTRRVLGQRTGGGGGGTEIGIMFETGADSKLNCYVGYGAGFRNIVSNSALSADTWYHVAVMRIVNTLKMSINGTIQTSTADMTGLTVSRSGDTVWGIGIEGDYNDNLYIGWIDEFRFSKGIARWTANFTPPTAAYPSADIGVIGGFF